MEDNFYSGWGNFKVFYHLLLHRHIFLVGVAHCCCCCVKNYFHFSPPFCVFPILTRQGYSFPKLMSQSVIAYNYISSIMYFVYISNITFHFVTKKNILYWYFTVLKGQWLVLIWFMSVDISGFFYSLGC